MFFRVLKLFGLDIPARVAEVRTTLEERVELAKVQVTERAQAAAAIAALSGLAGVAVFAAFGVGLVALYDWIALSYGQFYGYAAVVVVLLVLAATAVAAARLKAKSWSAETADRAAVKQRALTQTRVARVTAAAAALEAPPPPLRHPFQSHDSTSPSDLIEPLTLILSKMIKFPTFGHPLLDDLLVRLRGPVRGVADETVERVAHAVRYGTRSQLVMAMGVVLGPPWVTRNRRGLGERPLHLGVRCSALSPDYAPA
jgi:uncharacterized membrane protein YqjE